jgi:hypothetical protein
VEVTSALSLPALQLPLDSFADKFRPALVFLKRIVNTFERAFRESGWRLFVVDLGATSGHGRIIDDITNCNKPFYLRYHLLLSTELMISSFHQQRSKQMTEFQFQTIPAKFFAKHIEKVSNVRAFTLDNSFSGQATDAAAVETAVVRLDGKFQVNKQTGKGRVRLHSNHWLEFDYAV